MTGQFLLIVLLSACGASACATYARTPARSQPATLEGRLDRRALGIIITFHSGVDPVAVGEIPASKYHFNFNKRYVSGGAIYTNDLDLKLIPVLRCERDVAVVGLDPLITI